MKRKYFAVVLALAVMAFAAYPVVANAGCNLPAYPVKGKVVNVLGLLDHPEGALIAGQARKLGFTGPLCGADGIDNEDYIKIGGKAADNTYCTVPVLAASASPAGKEFAKQYKKAYGRDVDWMSANAYDCLGILAAVIAKTGPDRNKIRDGLAAMNGPKFGYEGITGLTFFNSKGDCFKPAFVKMVKDGKFVSAT